MSSIRMIVTVLAMIAFTAPTALAQEPWPYTVELYFGASRGTSDNKAGTAAILPARWPTC